MTLPEHELLARRIDAIIARAESVRTQEDAERFVEHLMGLIEQGESDPLAAEQALGSLRALSLSSALQLLEGCPRHLPALLQNQHLPLPLLRPLAREALRRTEQGWREHRAEPLAYGPAVLAAQKRGLFTEEDRLRESLLRGLETVPLRSRDDATMFPVHLRVARLVGEGLAADSELEPKDLTHLLLRLENWLPDRTLESIAIHPAAGPLIWARLAERIRPLEDEMLEVLMHIPPARRAPELRPQLFRWVESFARNQRNSAHLETLCHDHLPDAARAFHLLAALAPRRAALVLQDSSFPLSRLLQPSDLLPLLQCADGEARLAAILAQARLAEVGQEEPPARVEPETDWRRHYSMGTVAG